MCLDHVPELISIHQKIIDIIHIILALINSARKQASIRTVTRTLTRKGRLPLPKTLTHIL